LENIDRNLKNERPGQWSGAGDPISSGGEREGWRKGQWPSRLGQTGRGLCLAIAFSPHQNTPRTTKIAAKIKDERKLDRGKNNH